MAGHEKPSSPPGGPELQTVLTVTAGSSGELRKAFRWGTVAAPFAVGTKASWSVQAPGVKEVHLYIAFDGRRLQASAAEGASVTVHGAPLTKDWRPVPVRAELRFGGAAIAVTCEEVPAGEAAAPALAGPSNVPPSPRTLIVTGPEANDGAPPAPTAPLEPAVPRTGTLRLMERGWAPPEPVPEPPRTTGSDPPPARTATAVTPVRTEPIGRATPPLPTATLTAAHMPAGAVPMATLPTAQVSAAAMPAAKAPAAQMPVATMPVATVPVGAAPRAPITPPPAGTEATAPPGAFVLRATAASPQAVATGAVRRPGAMVPEAPITPPPEAPGGTSPPGALVPRAPLVPPPAGVPEVSFVAPQSDAVPTMADGGALREHAKRLESLPNVEVDPGAVEYFSVLRARSGRPPSDPPPAPVFVPNKPMAGKPVDEKRPPARAPEASKPVVETTEPEDKPKSGFAKTWKETSLVKKAILALLPLAAAATLMEKPAPAPAPAPAARTNARKAASKTAARPPASGAASPSTAESPETHAVPAPSTSAENSAPAQPAKDTAAPVVATASSAAAPSASADTDPDRQAFLWEHMALSAAFEGNLAQAAKLYEKVSALKPDSQLFALAARFTKEGAVRTP